MWSFLADIIILGKLEQIASKMVKYWVVFGCSSTHGGEVSVFMFSEDRHKKVS